MRCKVLEFAEPEISEVIYQDKSGEEKRSKAKRGGRAGYIELEQYVPTLDPADEHVAMNADWAADLLVLVHKLLMAFWTSLASSPQREERSVGLS